MSSLTVRLRGPCGQATLCVDATTTLSQFRYMVAEKTGVPPGQQTLCGGFPPAPLKLPADDNIPISKCPIHNGENLVVKSVPVDNPPTACAQSAPSHAAAPPSIQSAQESEDAELARALALSMQGQEGSNAQQAAGANHAATPPTATPPRGISGGEMGGVVRRVIDSDNSCLFNAVGYVMERDRKVAPKLRRVIADTVASDPVTFSEAFLGKPNIEYCQWILDSQHWGGAIELSILSKHYGREIAAYDIQTCRCDCYGQGEGYSERGMLIYDGLHYDALAVEAFPGGPEEVDLTVFSSTGPLADEIDADARRVVLEANKARKFTDAANFSIRCTTCQKGFVGQKEAIAHAKDTGHGNFSEY
mmetsp:Transcript_3378/g.6286  ORF Transcript_3378/g.6286 Transcript_3378/m.6286 type:complete len:361 (+) Transcript_3378:168-1250(+)